MDERTICLSTILEKTIVSRKHEDLLPLIDHAPFGLIGASVYNIDTQDSRKFDYYIAVSSTQNTNNKLERYKVPATTWAIFPCTRKTLHKIQLTIVNEWSKTSPYNLLNTGYQNGKMQSYAPDLEVYSEGESMEIWVPVQMKEGI